MEREERIGAWVSGVAHGAVILWAALAGALFSASEQDPIETVQVGTMSESDFQAMAAATRGPGPVSSGAMRPPPSLPPAQPPAADPAPSLPPAQPADTATAPPSLPGTAAPTETPAIPQAPLSPLALAQSATPRARPDGLVEAARARAEAVAAQREAARLAALAAEREAEARAAASRAEAERQAEAEAQRQAQAEAEAEAQRRAEAQAEAQAEADRRADERRLAREHAEAEAAAEARRQAAAEAARREAQRLEQERRQQAEAEEQRRQEEARQEERRREEARLEEQRREQARIEEERRQEEARREEERRQAEAEQERQRELDRLAEEARRLEEEQARTDQDELSRALAEAMAATPEAEGEFTDPNATDDPDLPRGPRASGVPDDDLTHSLDSARTSAAEPLPRDDLTATLDTVLANTPDAPSARESADPDAPVLTSAELGVLMTHIGECWNINMLSLDAQNTVITVEVRLDRAGVPLTDSLRLVDWRGGSEAAANNAFDVASRAIRSCGAEGLDLPADKYDRWKRLILDFDPRLMAERAGG